MYNSIPTTQSEEITHEIGKIEVRFNYYPPTDEIKNPPSAYKEGEVWKGWYASMPSMKGMGESGVTELDAFEQLMMSLKVKIAYDNNINLNSK